MKLQLLGTDTDSCDTLEQNAREALRIMRLDCTVEKITDTERIVQMGVMISPALAIDGQVISSGKVPTSEEIVVLLGSLRVSARNAEDAAARNVAVEEDFPCSTAEFSPLDVRLPEAAARPAANGGRRLVKGIFLVLIIFCAVFTAVNEIRARRAEAEAAGKNSSGEFVPAKSPRLTVYYCYLTPRSDADSKLEGLIRKMLDTQYSGEMLDNAITFSPVNLSDPAHAHFRRDYQLGGPGIVLQKGIHTQVLSGSRELMLPPDQLTARLRKLIDSMK